ncbi:hypothetical protein CROQUDRAFT_689033 [Cronartium quercuum f. sp. fusiforme G11]|uniref:Transposase n=1 Tax=Cronartium quercuum f. sp. fusiforme G11 TaxID=708437 RepID=A0A9P6N865_9BASI|nr:hypothetical protein CROQUDRAFT_689033 [Cronartium quercuum f. sp. fusiforme G11]
MVEPKYSHDIKLMTVWWLLSGRSLEEINELLGFDDQLILLSSLHRWLKLFLETHDVVVNLELYLHQGIERKLNDDQRNFVLDALKIDPTLYLDKLVAALLEGYGLGISTTTLATKLNYCLKWTRKKVQTVHPNQELAA